MRPGAVKTARVSSASSGLRDLTARYSGKNVKYYIKRRSGRVIGPFRARVIEQMIRSKQVDKDTEASEDKVEWQLISDLPEFAEIFGEDYSGSVARSRRARSAISVKTPAAPVPASASLSDLSSPRARLSLRDVSVGGPPMTKSSGDDQGWGDIDDLDMDLPPDDLDLPSSRHIPAGGVDLPKPKLRPSGRDDLPRLKLTTGATSASPAILKFDDLPRPRGEDDSLPRARRGGDLPQPRGEGDSLPRARRGGDLPQPRGEGDSLPRARRGGDLPQPRGEDDSLPRPRRGGDLPRPRGVGADLPEARYGDDLPNRRDGSVDLPLLAGSPSLRGGIDEPRTEDLPIARLARRENARGGKQPLFSEAERHLGQTPARGVPLLGEPFGGGGVPLLDEHDSLLGESAQGGTRLGFGTMDVPLGSRGGDDYLDHDGMGGRGDGHGQTRGFGSSTLDDDFLSVGNQAEQQHNDDLFGFDDVDRQGFDDREVDPLGLDVGGGGYDDDLGFGGGYDDDPLSLEVGGRVGGDDPLGLDGGGGYDDGPLGLDVGGGEYDDGPLGLDGGGFDDGPLGLDGGGFDGGPLGLDGGGFDDGPLGLDGGSDDDPLGLSADGGLDDDPLGLSADGELDDDPLGLSVDGGLDDDPLGLSADDSLGLDDGGGFVDGPLGMDSADADDPFGLAIGAPEEDELSLDFGDESDSMDFGLVDGGGDDGGLDLDLDLSEPSEAKRPPTRPKPTAKTNEVIPKSPAKVPAKPRPASKPKGAGGGRLRLLLVGLVLLGVAIGGLYFAKIGPFAETSTPAGPRGGAKVPTQTPKPVVKETPINVEATSLTLDEIGEDTFSAYHSYIKVVQELSASGGGDVRITGCLTAAQSMMMIRYPETTEREAEVEALASSLEEAAEGGRWSALGLAAWAVYQVDAEAATAQIQLLINQQETAYEGHLLAGYLAWRQLKTETFESSEARGEVLDVARSSFLRAIQEDPKSAGAQFAAGLVYHEDNNLPYAKEAFGKALDLAPNHASARLMLARMELDASKLDESKAHFSKLLEGGDLYDIASPLEKAQAHHLAGLHAMATHHLDHARVSLQKALEAGSQDPALLKDLARIYTEAKEYQAGIDFFTEKFGDKPEELEVILSLAQLYIAQSNIVGPGDRAPFYDNAARLLEKGNEIIDNDPRVAMLEGELYQSEAASLRVQGLSREMQEKFAAAETSYRSVVELDPNNAIASLNLARLLSKLNDPEKKSESVQLIDALRKNSALSVEVRIELGLYLLDIGDNKGGIAKLEEVSRLNASSIRVNEVLALHYLDKKNYPKAMEYLRGLEGLDALRPPTNYAYSSALYHTAGMDRSLLEKADIQIQSGLKEHPNEQQYLLLQSKIFFALGRFDAAKVNLENILPLEPANKETNYFLGRTELELGDAATALGYLQIAHRESKRDPEYGYYTAFAREQTKDRRGAISLYKDVIKRLKRDPESSFIEKMHLPYYRRGRLFRLEQKSLKAIPDLVRAVELKPEMTEAREELARAFFDSGKNYDKAIEQIESIKTDLGALSMEALVVQGVSYLELNQFEKARVPLEAARDLGYAQAQEINPIRNISQPAALYLMLARTYKGLKQNSKAVEAYTTYRDQAGLKGRDRREINRKIDNLK